MILRTQTVRFSPDRTPTPRKVKIGYESDNMVERLMFVLPDVAQSQTATMMMDGEYQNMVTLTAMDENGKYCADMTAERVGSAGEIECYIVIDGENGEVWNSGTFRLVTGELPDVSGELSEHFPDAIEQMRADIAVHRAEMGEQTAAVREMADAAEGSAANAAQSAEAAIKAGSEIQEAREAAEAAADAAGVSAAAARESAKSAEQSADRAEQTAATNGYVFFEIDSGHLIMTKAESVENLDFRLSNGRLEVVYG